MSVRRPLVIGNWKMNLGGRSGLDQARMLIGLAAEGGPDAPELVIAAPFTALSFLHDLTSDLPSPLVYGAQDISGEDAGAFTGEISGSMLAELGCRYALIGHSERRDRHQESGPAIGHKISAALRHGIVPVLCVGEDLPTRQADRQIAHTVDQVAEAVHGLDTEALAGLVIAYEPVWAIGTGEVATPADAQEVCGHLRDWLATRHGDDVADRTRLLYGGSVNPDSAPAILTQRDVDGALVGGASLDADALGAIWRAADRSGSEPSARRS